MTPNGWVERGEDGIQAPVQRVFIDEQPDVRHRHLNAKEAFSGERVKKEGQERENPQPVPDVGSDDSDPGGRGHFEGRGCSAVREQLPNCIDGVRTCRS